MVEAKILEVIHGTDKHEDETGSRVNGSLGGPMQNLRMGQLGPGSKFEIN